ncbi:hemolysin family protein [Sporomusa acidovorans]|uniref:Magnesium and cobalt efflux protein CorC n=1 Tax=Sporomusa acidovorans (strain ATCC 49682 / DSM 3132 / Mol) TaxID=1123286 RepID=A0ABZ3J0R9_SPOA4|nr:hemolysin family protein [Sporomusa acidovorans]OZC22538.1 magnesium and cobalt efflux protein CorC [Sporomusa acidovorans DSM 3132]SDE72642.1 putative hemolysin [Sporomusa acidovorans]
MDTASFSTEFIIILILILANGLFAMTEMSIVSSRKARLENMAASGSKGAQAALKLAEEPTSLLSAVQIGITLIGILTGTFGGAKLSGYLASFLNTIPVLKGYSEAISLTLVVGAITYVSLIIGELVPKKLALNNPEPIAAAIARPMTAFVRINRPLVHLLSLSTDMAMRLLGVKPPSEPPVTEEEVRVLIGQGAQHGVFEKAEREMLEKIFILGDMRVGALMTPRTQIKWLDLEDNDQYNLRIIRNANHLFFPVARGSLDDIVGVIYSNEILANYTPGRPLALEKAARQPLFIPKNTPALTVLENFKDTGNYVALVVDEYGGMSGLISLYDIAEHIVGDMPYLGEDEAPDVVVRDDGSWLVDGMLPAEELKDLLGVDHFPSEERGYFQTLGGFIVSYLGHIPHTTEKFEWNEYIFEIVDMDKARVDKVLITRKTPLVDGDHSLD